MKGLLMVPSLNGPLFSVGLMHTRPQRPLPLTPAWNPKRATAMPMPHRAGSGTFRLNPRDG